MENINCDDYYSKKVQTFNYVGSEIVTNLRIKGQNCRKILANNL
jgi:hypothetical protein